MNTLQITLFVLLAIGILVIIFKQSEGFTISDDMCQKKESILLNGLNASSISTNHQKEEKKHSISSYEQKTNNQLKNTIRDNASCLPTDICDKPGLFQEVNNKKEDIEETPPDFFNDKRAGYFIYEDDPNDKQI